MNSSRQSQLILIALCALALLVRMFHLSTGPINLDEGYTILAARAGLFASLRNGPCDWNPPGAVFPYSLWFLLFGSDRATLELLSVICGVVSLVLSALLANRMFSSSVAVKLMILGALSEYHLLYSQFIRIYSAGLCGLMLAVLLLVEHWMRPRRWKAVSFIAVSFVVINLHYYAAFAVFSILLGGLIICRDDRPFRRFVTRAGVALALLFIPTLLWQARVIRQAQAGSWLEPIDAATLASIWYQFSSESIILLILFLSLLIIGVRRGLSRPNLRSQTALLLCWLCAPIGIATLLSIVGGSIIHVRYFIFCLVPFLLLVANGWELLPNQLARQVLGFIIAIASAFSIHNYFHQAASLEQDSEIYRTVSSSYRAGDIILHTSKCSFVSSGYDHKFSFPEFITSDASSWVLRCTMANPPDKDLFEQSNISRLWVVDTDCFPHRAGSSRPDLSGLKLIAEYSFSNGGLYLYERSAEKTVEGQLPRILMLGSKPL